jgi:hypothetical protein
MTQVGLKPEAYAQLNGHDEVRYGRRCYRWSGLRYAIARLKVPVHVVGLIPATDNRPGEDADAPGDVVPMMNGMNVEVLRYRRRGAHDTRGCTDLC